MTPLIASCIWIAALGSLAFYVFLKSEKRDSDRDAGRVCVKCESAFFSSVRRVLGLTTPFLAILTIVQIVFGDNFAADDQTGLGGWTLAAMIFWLLAPPTYFFVEYMAAEAALLGVTTGAMVKGYSDFASKIWAAFLAIYVFSLADQVKKRELQISTSKEIATKLETLKLEAKQGRERAINLRNIQAGSWL